MSYLDRPRINFSGKFQASPSTINNAPNNYNPDNYNPDSLKPEKIELYWQPKGDAIFDLIECQVTSVETSVSGADTILGGSVSALNTGNRPKLADLDPMQQNGSELWGLTVMIGDFGGAYVQGTFTPISFNGIWGNSQGKNTPHNSTSGAAVYQSTLTIQKWNVGDSAVLKALNAVSPKRLSIRMVVSAHNNAPHLYAFNSKTFDAMRAGGIPEHVLTKIDPLKKYVMNFPSKGATPFGIIPTPEYVDHLLQQSLGQSTAGTYRNKILDLTKQPYAPWIDYDTNQPLAEQPLTPFDIGKVVGSVGPWAEGEPFFAVPARALAPHPAPLRQTTSKTPQPPPPPPPLGTLLPPTPPPPPAGWWAQAKLDLDSKPPTLTIDLANSLPVPLPGRPLWKDALGTLSLAYYTGSGTNKTYTTIVKSIDYANPDFIDKQSGMLVVTNFGSVNPKILANLPLAIRYTPPGGVTTTLLEESPEGLSLRADQFIFRMSPGMKTTQDFPLGETNTVDIYVRKFGRVEGTDGLKIGLHVLDPNEAANYTLSTLGTSGTHGIGPNNVSTPEGKLRFSSNPVNVVGGKATVTITATDPGNPRSFIDGQVYFATYDFSPQAGDYHQDPNDIISAHIYQQNPITGTPTWLNGIGQILRQYGMLYPIMGQFKLWTYEGVVENRDKIQGVLSMDMSQPLHMPVTRDLSPIRCKLILDWFKAGMPYGVIGPVGGPGTSWNNLPTVSDWGSMTGVVIRAGYIVDSIQPRYGTRLPPAAGGNGGTESQFDLQGDPIVRITGYTGTFLGSMHIVQLSFKTAGNKTGGPFGTKQTVKDAQPFELHAPSGCAIRSFFGTSKTHSDGKTYLASIGANVQPL